MYDFLLGRRMPRPSVKMLLQKSEVKIDLHFNLFVKAVLADVCLKRVIMSMFFVCVYLL